ncbi:MAG: rhomboid family intramembrane serine protease [Planctomycetaceae bacterium]|jgi:membrane associated rhomboid family serine protease|nr:rhomboid family intramembrane serine protease [Planctomycetaceae bacterium]
MGFQDRDYYRGNSPRQEYYHIQTQQSWVFAIIVVNIMVFAANFIRGENVINDLLMMRSTTLYHPAEWWRLITYAFAHANFQHIFFNMFALFFFGPLVERRYGPTEFLCFYLITSAISGLGWGALNLASGHSMLGASGAVSGVVMLVIWNYPRMLVYVWGIIETPMWLMGVFYIAMDLFGFLGYSGDRVAHEAHLAGTAFGALYAWQKWRFCSIPYFFTSGYWKERARKRKFFHPQDYADAYNGRNDKDDTRRLAEEDTERTEQVDAILRKISEKGQDSLTWNERRILKRASEEYQKKHKPK